MVKTIKLYLKVIVLIQMISLFFQSIKKKKKKKWLSGFYGNCLNSIHTAGWSNWLRIMYKFCLTSTPGLDLSFWSTVVKIYPFTTLRLVNKDKNIKPNKFSQLVGQYIWQLLKTNYYESTVSQVEPAFFCSNSVILLTY